DGGGRPGSAPVLRRHGAQGDKAVESPVVKIRGAALAAAVAAVLGGVILAFGPLRAVWLNTGLRIDYPWPRGASALVAAGGALGLAVLTRSRVLRLLAGALSLALALGGAALLLYRLEALAEGLVE